MEWIFTYVEFPFRRGVLDTTLCDKVCRGSSKQQYVMFGPMVSDKKTETWNSYRWQQTECDDNTSLVNISPS
jgi:hypothetical protein